MRTVTTRVGAVIASDDVPKGVVYLIDPVSGDIQELHGVQADGFTPNLVEEDEYDDFHYWGEPSEVTHTTQHWELSGDSLGNAFGQSDLFEILTGRPRNACQYEGVKPYWDLYTIALPSECDVRVAYTEYLQCWYPHPHPPHTWDWPYKVLYLDNGLYHCDGSPE